MQDYSCSFITAAIALVVMVIFISVEINVKRKLWTSLFAKVPYIIGGLLTAIVITEREAIINFLLNPPMWVWIVGFVILTFDVVLLLLLLRRGNRIERQEADA